MSNISQSQEANSASRELWLRWMLFWHGLFYVSVIIATGIFLMLNASSWEERAIALGLSLVLGTWYGVCVIIPPLYWRARAPLALGYLCLGWALWLGLLRLDSVYLLLLVGFYPQAFVLLPTPWNLPGGMILLGLTLWRDTLGRAGWTATSFYAMGAGIVGMVLALFIETIVRQSLERARLIEELEATRQELARAERQAGIMQERQRLAGEIHDTFTQGFTSIVMQIETVESADGAVKHALEQVRQIARANLTEARQVLWALQPEIFAQTTLPAVLATLTERWSQESGLVASSCITGNPCPLYPEIEVTLLRASQEALANVRKHARASSVVLTLSYLDDVVLLDLQDDGQGFALHDLPSASLDQATGGFGLQALRERVEQLGGTLTLEGAPGEGTTLAVSLPMLRKSEALAFGSAEGSRL